MALRGNAALAMWWDMSAGMRDEFEHWHTHQHFPERLGIPGFLRSTRWTDADGGEAVFVLYELEDHAVLSSAAYLARLDAPTPWSTQLMPHHRNMVRAQSHVELSCGGLAARYAMTLRFSAVGDAAVRLPGALLLRLRDACRDAGVVGAHLLRHESPPIDLTTEQRIRGNVDKAPDRVLLLCGYSSAALHHTATAIDDDPAFVECARRDDGGWRTYALSYSTLPSDLS